MSSIELTPSQKKILRALTNLHKESEDAIKGEDIAAQVDRNPGTIRNQMQSLKASNSSRASPVPRVGTNQPPQPTKPSRSSRWMTRHPSHSSTKANPSTTLSSKRSTSRASTTRTLPRGNPHSGHNRRHLRRRRRHRRPDAAVETGHRGATRWQRRHQQYPHSSDRGYGCTRPRRNP